MKAKLSGGINTTPGQVFPEEKKTVNKTELFTIKSVCVHVCACVCMCVFIHKSEVYLERALKCLC